MDVLWRGKIECFNGQVAQVFWELSASGVAILVLTLSTSKWLTFPCTFICIARVCTWFCFLSCVSILQFLDFVCFFIVATAWFCILFYRSKWLVCPRTEIKLCMWLHCLELCAVCSPVNDMKHRFCETELKRYLRQHSTVFVFSETELKRYFRQRSTVFVFSD